MLKKFFAVTIVASMLGACASWFDSSSTPDNPNVGSKDSSDFLFGQSASAPVASGTLKELPNNSNASSAQ